MTRLLLTILLLCAPTCRGAVQWVIAGAAVETNGWVLRLTNWTAPNLDATTAANTNLQFFNGFGTNNSPSATNGLTLTLTSMGFDDYGNGIQVGRTVYGTKVLRMPYSMQNTNDIQPDAVTNCVMRIALSDWVYAKDSNLVMTLRQGAFAQTNSDGTIGTNCMATNAFAVINGSTNDYQKVIGKWSWPGHNRITNDTVTARAVCFHGSAQEGRPVRSVRFVCTSTNTGQAPTTNWILRPAIDRAMGDAMPVIEYVSTHDISAVSNGSPLRLDFTAYPWVGDSGAVLDTFTDTRTGETQPCSQTNLCDRQKQYWSFAIVSALGNSSGVVSNTPLDTANPPAPFDTVSNALNAMIKSNGFWYGQARSNLSCGTIYFDEGDHFVSAQNIFTAFGDAWLTFAPHPTNVAKVQLTTNCMATQRFGQYLKVQGMWIWMTNGVTGFYRQWAVWADRCTLDGGANSTLGFLQLTNTFFTRCTFLDYRSGTKQTAVAGASPPMGVPLVRGNTIWTNSLAMYPYCIIGNRWPQTNTTAAQAISDFSALFGSASPDGGIVAYNSITRTEHTVHGIYMGALSGTGGSSNRYYGLAIVQNLVEMGNNAQCAIFCGADLTTNDLWNVLMWNNTTIGARNNTAYNDRGVVPRERLHWSLNGNNCDNANIKSDRFNDPVNGPQGGRVGNWSQVYSVKNSGNWFGQVTNVGVGFSYAGGGSGESMGWPGIESIQTTTTIAKPTNAQHFIDHRACNDGVAGAGGGNYRLRSDSELLQLKTSWILPYDLDGVPRGASDPPGAYASGNPKKGAFF